MILADMLGEKRTIFTAWSSMAANAVVELLARSPFDAVTLDMQHGEHDIASVREGLLPLILAGKGAIVRIPVGRFDMASRALDFGAEAVIAPMINDVMDAKAFAASMKYPPLGQRSWGPQRGMDLHGAGDPQAYLRQANGRTLAFAMIETRKALDALDGILTVEGIDGVFVGPADFSISWTDGAALDPHNEEMAGTLADVAGRARSAGKHAGLFVVDPARARHYAGFGYNLLAIVNDVAFLKAGLATAHRAASGDSV